MILTLIFDYYRQIQFYHINQEYKASWTISCYTNILTRYSIYGFPVAFINFRPLNICVSYINCENVHMSYLNFLIKNIKSPTLKSKLPVLYFCSNIKCICRLR